MAVAMRAAPTPRATPGRSAPLATGRSLLTGWYSIRFRIDHVVDEVGARSHDAEDQEGHDHAQRRVPFAEHARGGGRHEDQEVLQPLPRTRTPGEQAQRRTGRGRAEVVQRHDAVVAVAAPGAGRCPSDVTGRPPPTW